jgi:hypothetical protein
VRKVSSRTSHRRKRTHIYAHAYILCSAYNIASWVLFTILRTSQPVKATLISIGKTQLVLRRSRPSGSSKRYDGAFGFCSHVRTCSAIMCRKRSSTSLDMHPSAYCTHVCILCMCIHACMCYQARTGSGQCHIPTNNSRAHMFTHTCSRSSCTKKSGSTTKTSLRGRWRRRQQATGNLAASTGAHRQHHGRQQRNRKRAKLCRSS